MLATLILVACLAREPSRCEEVRPPVEVTMMECLMGTPAHLPQWEDEHPGRLVRRWRCELGERS